MKKLDKMEGVSVYKRIYFQTQHLFASVILATEHPYLNVNACVKL